MATDHPTPCFGRRFRLRAVCALSASVIVACSSESTTPVVTPTDSGVGADTGAGDSGSSDAGTDAAALPVVNACRNYVDRTAESASRMLTWDFSISDADERCLLVKKGQVVTFMGDFVSHPLQASNGDKPNPIATPDQGKVTFPAVGTFGYVCSVHPAMTGAIRVVE